MSCSVLITWKSMRKSNIFRVERVSYLYCFFCVLQPPSPEEKEVLEDEVKGPSGPRQWIGLGSEREIEEESVREMRKTVDSYVRSIFFLIFTLFLIFILYLSLVQPLCLFVVICFSFFFCGQLQYTFSRERRKFGLPVCFSDRSAADAQAGLIDCVSYQDSNFSIKRVQQDCTIQAIPKLRSSSAQTQWYFSKAAHADTVVPHRDIRQMDIFPR